MEPIDDYIEPLIKIQKLSNELNKLTLHKKFEAAYLTSVELETEVAKLKNWCWNNIDKQSV